jgi:hypothetical protein
MKIKCPKCNQIISAEQINIAADLAMCDYCDESFRASECLDTGKFNSEEIHTPPKGAWFREEYDRVVVGATTRSPIAFILVPFMCVWSGGSLGGIYGSQIVSGEFNLMISLFGIPFVLGSILFWSLAIMAICGKVEVRIAPNDSSVFVGVGSIGWRRRFNFEQVHTIREQGTSYHHSGSHQGSIVLEGQSRIKFATGLNENRRYFMLNTLKWLKAR